MKICLLAHNLNIKNGAGRVSFELIRHLKEADPVLEIKVLTVVGSNHGFEQAIIRGNKFRLLLSLRRIRKIFKESEIIHALDGWPFGVVAALGSYGLKKKLIITAIGSGSIKPLHQFVRKWLLKWAYGRADRVTAISSYTAREINKVIPDLKLEIIRHGVNFDFFTDKGKGISFIEDKPYLLSVGWLKPRKGYLRSIQAFSRISQKIPNLKYVIVGSGRGEYYKKLASLITELNLLDKVIFKENISDDELAALYRQAELFWLLPQNDNYDVEGFGLVFLEAAAFGLPVIGARDCGAEDAIFDKQNGFLVDSQNLDEVVKKILEILSDDLLRIKFSRRSIEIARKMSYHVMVKNYLKIYQNL